VLGISSIKHPAQKLFHTLPSFVNLNVSTMTSVVAEELNEFDSSAILTMLQALGFLEEFL